MRVDKINFNKFNNIPFKSYEIVGADDDSFQFGKYLDLLDNGVRVDKFEKGNKGKNYLTVNIDGDTFKLSTRKSDLSLVLDDMYLGKDSAAYDNSLAEVVDNIRDMHSGFFVRTNKYEDFVPHMHKGYPNMLKDRSLLKNGNSVTILNDDTEKACDILSEISGKDVDSDLKTVVYGIKKYVNADNYEKRIAYGYYDEEYDIQYLYMPDKNLIKCRFANDVIFKKKIKHEEME